MSAEHKIEEELQEVTTGLINSRKPTEELATSGH